MNTKLIDNHRSETQTGSMKDHSDLVSAADNLSFTYVKTKHV